eukprot:TRINITY_DN532_c1_g1_i4.p1 TRINITY_DN532_c1_g1~~TRINITY_DN532_c1_g1_i4.p1  ORF type:complete len:391 (+),score=53.25 TRINITY_DN532_c1_g1_i4:148-1173(+)
MPGATITLVGSGFGTLATNATVSVNGTACSITVFTPLHIECTPSFVVGSRGVTVSRKGFGTSNMLSFVVQITATRTRTVTRQTRTRTRTESHQTRSRSRTSTRQTRTRTLTRTRTRTRTNFLRPDISSITPAVVLIGATVVISGINFGTAANATIGGVPCVSPTVTGSGTQLTCVVPAVAPGVQPIRVSCNGLFDQSARSLTVVQPFALSQLSPPEGQYGTLVNISAAGLLGGVSTLTPADVTVLVSGTAQRSLAAVADCADAAGRFWQCGSLCAAAWSGCIIQHCHFRLYRDAHSRRYHTSRANCWWPAHCHLQRLWIKCGRLECDGWWISVQRGANDAE